jgi:hypothetical protein
MRTPTILAAISAVALAPVLLSGPSAVADTAYTGTVETTDPVRDFPAPTPAEQCGTEGVPYTLNYDTVEVTAQATAPATITLRAAGAATEDLLLLQVYRGATCLAATHVTDEGDAPGVLDLEGVALTKGEKVQVVVAVDFPAPAGQRLAAEPSFPWKLEVRQAGTPNGSAEGPAVKYVGLPEQVTCATGTADATLTKAAKKTAKKGKVKKIVFTAGGAKVATVKAKQIKKAVKKGVVLAGIPKTATSIDVKVKLTNGKKKTATRAYSAC